MKSPAARFPKLFKLIKWTAIAFLILLALLFCFSQFENWRGRRAWVEAETGLRAKGLRASWSEIQVTPVPEAENRVLARIFTGSFKYYGKWSEMGQWESEPIFGEAAEKAAEQARKIFSEITLGDAFGFQISETEQLDIFGETHKDRIEELREILEPYSSNLSELITVCQERSQSYLPGDYTRAIESPIPNFQYIRRTSRLLTAEAIIALHEGDSARALGCVQALICISNLNPQVPLLINTMIEVVCVRNFISEILWYGVTENAFDLTELETIQKLSQKTDLAAKLSQAFELEILCALDATQVFICLLYTSPSPRD